jgi:hypothetical protein
LFSRGRVNGFLLIHSFVHEKHEKKQKLPLRAAQSFGDSLQIAIALNMFVLFVFFVDKYGFFKTTSVIHQ